MPAVDGRDGSIGSLTPTEIESFAMAFLEESPDAVVITDPDGRIAYVNVRAEAMFGYDSGELLGATVERLVPEALVAAHRTHRAAYERAPAVRAMGEPGLDLQGCRRDGTVFPVEIGLSPVETAKGTQVMACVRDLTERHEAQRRARSDREARRIAEDRERIARDLHDVVIQRLFAAGMRLQAARGRPETLPARCDETVAELDETISVIRRTIFDLTGAAPTELSARIRQMADAHADRTGVPVSVDLSGDIDALDDDIAAGLIASLSEALSNVARHAEATSVEVTVSVDDRVTLKVVDDGVGISSDRPSGFGLPNIASRASSLAGELHVEAGPRGGTTLEWRVPVS